MNGDGKTDILATTVDGRLFYYKNNGTTTPFSTSVYTVIGSGWQNFNRIVVGDVNGDGKTDILATTVDGRLFYYQNNATPTPYGTSAYAIIGTGGWQNFDQIA